MQSPDEEKKIKQVQGLNLTGQGFVLAAAMLLFGGAGYWLDNRFGTLPVLTVIGIFLGFIGGMIETYQLAKRTLKR